MTDIAKQVKNAVVAAGSSALSSTLLITEHVALVQVSYWEHEHPFSDIVISQSVQDEWRSVESLESPEEISVFAVRDDTFHVSKFEISDNPETRAAEIAQTLLMLYKMRLC